MASSGNAALLLPNGTNAHSCFKTLIKCDEGSICSIPGRLQFVDLLHQTSLTSQSSMISYGGLETSAVRKYEKERM
ncbi:hypothetical protein K470DRAFT_259442 [Piedraia hortae CBS 480.64]|uniref:ATP-dependent DNA helicase n=1 Tax=Piedraia hortae CBS 480.64 TaxID=1314780 RepID=A0A6A7BUC0_9PEZI|nr:hypothetical protein K470DRAFT_259442 [Piedraia hortae CBS 480.64]